MKLIEKKHAMYEPKIEYWDYHPILILIIAITGIVLSVLVYSYFL